MIIERPVGELRGLILKYGRSRLGPELHRRLRSSSDPTEHQARDSGGRARQLRPLLSRFASSLPICKADLRKSNTNIGRVVHKMAHSRDSLHEFISCTSHITPAAFIDR